MEIIYLQRGPKLRDFHSEQTADKKYKALCCKSLRVKQDNC